MTEATVKLNVSKGHLNAVANYLKWQNQARTHYWRFMHALEPLSLTDERFWSVLEFLRECVAEARSTDIEKVNGGAREFFRRAYLEDWMDDALKFVKAYKKLKGRLSKALGDLYEFHGDSFGDLCDSLPLGGRALVERALKTGGKPKRAGFLDETEVDEALAALEPAWKKLAGHEVYVEGALEEHAQEYLQSYIRKELLTQEQGEEIESMKVVEE